MYGYAQPRVLLSCRIEQLKIGADLDAHIAPLILRCALGFETHNPHHLTLEYSQMGKTKAQKAPYIFAVI